ncbi:hypothetical protein [Luminiphilus syltensis]|nr:hypothetical protein [Luminiphilus syltensis]
MPTHYQIHRRDDVQNSLPERREDRDQHGAALETKLTGAQQAVVLNKRAQGFAVRFMREHLFFAPEVVLEAPDGFTFFIVSANGRMSPFYNLRDGDVS